MKQALFWENDCDQAVCLLCPTRCRVAPGKSGACRARKNVDGVLYAATYGECTAFALDPIEKKPLYHFYPGSAVVSVGTRGCNLGCKFCQNWEIAQGDPVTEPISSEEIVQAATLRREDGCVGIAYTYSEPLVWYEFVYDTAKLAKQAGLANVLVTNGEINREPMEALLPFIDAMNIDVKAFTDNFYQRTCGGRLEPVLKTAELVHDRCHVEITNLVIPTLNDSPDEIRRLVDWVADALGPDTPLHFSRYFPQHKLDIPPTPPETLEAAWEIGRNRLRYVYVGNLWGGKGNDTYCYSCGERVIERRGFEVWSYDIEDGKCKRCGAEIKVIGTPVQ